VRALENGAKITKRQGQRRRMMCRQSFSSCEFLEITWRIDLRNQSVISSSQGHQIPISPIIKYCIYVCYTRWVQQLLPTVHASLFFTLEWRITAILPYLMQTILTVICRESLLGLSIETLEELLHVKNVLFRTVDFDAFEALHNFCPALFICF